MIASFRQRPDAASMPLFLVRFWWRQALWCCLHHPVLLESTRYIDILSGIHEACIERALLDEGNVFMVEVPPPRVALRCI